MNHITQREQNSDPGIKGLHSAILNVSQLEPNSAGLNPGYNSVIVSGGANRQQVPQSAAKSVTSKGGGRPPQQQQRLDSNRSMSHMSTYRTAQTRSRKQHSAMGIAPTAAPVTQNSSRDQHRRNSLGRPSNNLDHLSGNEPDTSRSLATTNGNGTNPIRVISFSIM